MCSGIIAYATIEALYFLLQNAILSINIFFASADFNSGRNL